MKCRDSSRLLLPLLLLLQLLSGTPVHASPPVNWGCCSPSSCGCDCPGTVVVSVTLLGDASGVPHQPTVVGLVALSAEHHQMEKAAGGWIVSSSATCRTTGLS